MSKVIGRSSRRSVSAVDIDNSLISFAWCAVRGTNGSSSKAGLIIDRNNEVGAGAARDIRTHARFRGGRWGGGGERE